MSKLGYLHTKFTPAQGYYTIENIPTENSKDSVIYKQEKEAAFLKGKIIKVGKPRLTDEGTVITPDYKEGDIVLYSFSGFEQFLEQGDTINLIRFQAVHGKYED